MTEEKPVVPPAVETKVETPVADLVKAAVDKALAEAKVSHDAELSAAQADKVKTAQELADYRASVARKELVSSIVQEYHIHDLSEFLDGGDEAALRAKAKKLADRLKTQAVGAPAPVAGPRAEPVKDADWAKSYIKSRRPYIS